MPVPLDPGYHVLLGGKSIYTAPKGRTVVNVWADSKENVLVVLLDDYDIVRVELGPPPYVRVH